MRKSTDPYTRNAVGCAVILVAFIVIVAITLLFAQRSIRDEIRKTRSVLDASNFECPEGSTIEVERWSELGWSLYCKKDGEKHGPWQAWSKQVVTIEGSYRSGKAHGEFRVFNPDGSLYRLIEYRDGEEVSDSLSEPN